jgi:hypothetical protein
LYPFHDTNISNLTKQWESSYCSQNAYKFVKQPGKDKKTKKLKSKMKMKKNVFIWN